VPRLACLVLGLLAAPAEAVIVAPQPGQTVVVLEERAVLVYDPLTSSQTMVVQVVVEGTSAPFGLLIPTPRAAEVAIAPDRVRRALMQRLHPPGRVQRTLDLRFTSWISSCALRDVGDGAGEAADAERRQSARGEGAFLGAEPDATHDWLIANGLTLAPAQASWLAELRQLGWSVTAVVITPPEDGGVPPPRMNSPTIAVTHPAEEPVYASGFPAFSLGTAASLPPDLELAVFTEWAVELPLEAPPEPFFADVLTRKDVNRMEADAGGLPWSFRREGTLTAWRLPGVIRPSTMRLSRVDPRHPVRPPPEPVMRAYRFDLPVELLILTVVLLVRAWLSVGRRRRGLQGQRI
jgi:hypothetical protein